MSQKWSTSLTKKITRDGTTYGVRVLGLERADGTWEGRVEFRNKTGKAVTTEQETSQPNLTTLDYWAGGLEEVYLEGALERALDLQKKKRA